MSSNIDPKSALDSIHNELLNIDKEFYVYDNDKFTEISSSLAYYLKTFSNLKRFFEYIVLISKYLINKECFLIIPLNEKGQIWVDNINSYEKSLNRKIDLVVKEFCISSQLLGKFKIKNITVIEDFLSKNFSDYKIKTFKITSRNKCRGFFCTFQKTSHNQSDFNEERNINFIINNLAVGIENYLLLKNNKKHENVDKEISSGAEIQSRLLPDFCPVIEGVDLSAHCRPALQLGGDLFDFMSIKPNIEEKRRQKGRWGLVIGDVMGKGIPAGLFMTMLRGMLRAEVLTGLPPDRILHDLNQLALYDLDQSHRFITLFYSDYDPRTRKLRFANAAHNPPLLWKSSENKISRLDAKGVVIGLEKEAEYQCGEVQLNTADVILYYTDGITETANNMGERFGEQKLIAAFRRLCKKQLSAKDILKNLFKTLDEYSRNSRETEDDASIVVFRLN